MTTVNVHQAKTHFSRYLDEVEGGGEVTITRHGKPTAKLVAVSAQAKRPLLGSAKGKWVVPDDWYERDKEVDKEIEKLFYGETD